MQPQITDASPYSGSPPPIDALRVLGHSGLFDAAYYLGCNHDLAGLGSEALAHYHLYGWREGRKPNGIMYHPPPQDSGADPLTFLPYVDGIRTRHHRLAA